MIINLLNKNRNSKVTLQQEVIMERVDFNSGTVQEDDSVVLHSRKARLILLTTNLDEAYDQMVDETEQRLAEYLKNGSTRSDHGVDPVTSSYRNLSSNHKGL